IQGRIEPTTEREEEAIRQAAADEDKILADLETKDLCNEVDPRIWVQFAAMMSTEWRMRALDASRRGDDVTFRISVRHSRKWEAFEKNVLVQIAAKKRAEQARTQRMPEHESEAKQIIEQTPEHKKEECKEAELESQKKAEVKSEEAEVESQEEKIKTTEEAKMLAKRDMEFMKLAEESRKAEENRQVAIQRERTRMQAEVEKAKKKKAKVAEAKDKAEQVRDTTIRPPVSSIPREEQQQPKVLIVEPDVVNHHDSETISYVPLKKEPIDHIISEYVGRSETEADKEIENAIDAIKKSGLEIKKILEAAEARRLANPGE
ncbi:hypothetical protein BdWA1_003343, partial [Babesia duncani]